MAYRLQDRGEVLEQCWKTCNPLLEGAVFLTFRRLFVRCPFVSKEQ
ncbi:hypothetical protein ARMA_1562 [Ardenticatena maritima]|uniref:Uncharacterized protein n=1 Tax=Ardenticatena maritima TaxID=872965 RepID=A0A0M8K9D1_9CHLR|nr:hypothetical protein ARMA_1562 [Ardenticatena maritima]